MRWLVWTAAGMTMLAACAKEQPAAPTAPEPPAIAVRFDNPNPILNPMTGLGTRVTITVERRGTFSGPVSLTVTGATDGVTARLDPQVMPPGQAQGTLYLEAHGGNDPQRVDLVVTATGDGVDSVTQVISLWLLTYNVPVPWP